VADGIAGKFRPAMCMVEAHIGAAGTQCVFCRWALLCVRVPAGFTACLAAPYFFQQTDAMPASNRSALPALLPNVAGF
jgi:hypothetical protein